MNIIQKLGVSLYLRIRVDPHKVLFREPTEHFEDERCFCKALLAPISNPIFSDDMRFEAKSVEALDQSAGLPSIEIVRGVE